MDTPAENVFAGVNGDSFLSASSLADTKKVPSSLRKSSLERLYAHVDRRTDVLWQEKPARVLAYKASAVHQYGWIPLNIFNWRTVKATVFSSVLLNIQTVCLVAWALLIHTTGLGMPEYDIRAFLKIWGTVYAGAVFNLATVVVFILGLFISLVINRWWSIRTAYAKFVSACSDLTMMSAVNVRDARGAPHGTRAARARLELVRLINLTHVLVCIMADGANKNLRGKKISTEGEHTFGRASMHTLGFQELFEEGLVNEDEWETILANEAYGMPRYMTVMYWVEALIHKCKEKGVINPTQQTIQSMTAKVGAISDSASSIFTLIRSQMPYPYVHLVSFTVHFYLFFWATYVGCLLHSGIPDGSVTQGGSTAPLDVASEGISADDAWGLLNIHVLLDNPYGDHCTKFPLRAQIVELLNASRTMLSFTDQLPSVVAGIFTNTSRVEDHPRTSSGGADVPAATTAGKRASDGEQPCLRPTPPVPTTPAPTGSAQESPSPVQATPQELGKMSEKALSQVAEAIIHATRRQPSSSTALRPIETSAVKIQQHTEKPHSSAVSIPEQLTQVSVLQRPGAKPTPLEVDEDPSEHLFMLRARSTGASSPFLPTAWSPRSPSQPHARQRSAAQHRSSRTSSTRKSPLLARVSAPFRLVRSPGGQSSPSSSHSQSHPLTQTVARPNLHVSPRAHSSHVRFQADTPRTGTDTELTPRDGTSHHDEEDSSEMIPEGTVSFTAEQHTSLLETSSSPSAQIHLHGSQNILPEGLPDIVPSGASDLACTSHLIRMASSTAARNFASDGSLLGHYVSTDANYRSQSTAANTIAQSGSGDSTELSKRCSSGTTNAQPRRVVPCMPNSSTPDCNTDASESPLARPEAPTLLHSNIRSVEGVAGSSSSQRDTQSLAAMGSLDNGSLTLNVPAGVSGMGVQSHVLPHVASSHFSVPSVPSGSSSASDIRKEKDKTSFATAYSSTPPQSVGSTKSHRRFPPLMPKSQPLSTVDAGSSFVSVTALVENNEEDDAVLLAENGPRSSEEVGEIQQNRGSVDAPATGKSSSSGGGRRWFSMFASPAKSSVNNKSIAKSQDMPPDASAAPEGPRPPQHAARRPSTDRRLSVSLALQGSVAEGHPSRPSDGLGAGHAKEIAKVSSEAALRRVGPHAVFNTTTMMNPGDAKFLDEARLMRRESSFGPEATTSQSAEISAQLRSNDPARRSGGSTSIVQRPPEAMQPSSEGSLILSRVQESAAVDAGHKKSVSSVSVGSARSPTEKSINISSRSGLLGESSADGPPQEQRHVFKT